MESAIRAPLALRLVDVTRPVGHATVGFFVLNGPLEEALARLARQQAVMVAGHLVSTDGTQLLDAFLRVGQVVASAAAASSGQRRRSNRWRPAQRGHDGVHQRRRTECGAAGRVARLVIACVIRSVNAIGIESSESDRHAHAQQIAAGLDAARAQVTHGIAHGRATVVVVVVIVITSGTERRQSGSGTGRSHR